MIRVVAAMGGEVERHREALLPGGEVAAVERVGIFRRGEAGILPDGPGLVDIHRGVGAAQIRRDAGEGLEEIDAFEVGFVVARFDRECPRASATARRCRRAWRDGLECDIRKLVCGSFLHLELVSLDQSERSSCRPGRRMVRVCAVQNRRNHPIRAHQIAADHALSSRLSPDKRLTPSIMVRMLVADDAVKLFRRRNSAAWSCSADWRSPTTQPSRDSVPYCIGRHHPVRPVEGAGHDLDPWAVDAAVAQRRAAIARRNRARRSRRSGTSPACRGSRRNPRVRYRRRRRTARRTPSGTSGNGRC